MCFLITYSAVQNLHTHSLFPCISTIAQNLTVVPPLCLIIKHLIPLHIYDMITLTPVKANSI